MLIFFFIYLSLRRHIRAEGGKRADRREGGGGISEEGGWGRKEETGG